MNLNDYINALFTSNDSFSPQLGVSIYSLPKIMNMY